MIMDTFAALALATEEPHPKLLKRPPHSRDSYIVSGVTYHISFIYYLGYVKAYFSSHCFLIYCYFGLYIHV